MAKDSRVPVVFGEMADLGLGDALVVSPGQAAPKWGIVVRLPAAHAIGCACCAGRDPWAEALGVLFVAMVKGERPRFERVLAVLDPRAAARLAALLAADRLLAARFRRARDPSQGTENSD